MWNKGIGLLWLKIQITNNRHVHFSFPLPLYIIQELMDSILDLVTFLCLFVPEKRSAASHSKHNIHFVREAICSIMILFDSLTEGGPYELVDVSADHVRVSVKVR